MGGFEGVKQNSILIKVLALMYSACTYKNYGLERFLNIYMYTSNVSSLRPQHRYQPFTYTTFVKYCDMRFEPLEASQDFIVYVHNGHNVTKK